MRRDLGEVDWSQACLATGNNCDGVPIIASGAGDGCGEIDWSKAALRPRMISAAGGMCGCDSVDASGEVAGAFGANPVGGDVEYWASLGIDMGTRAGKLTPVDRRSADESFAQRSRADTNCVGVELISSPYTASDSSNGEYFRVVDEMFKKSDFSTEAMPYLLETGYASNSGELGRFASVNVVPKWIAEEYPDYVTALRFGAGAGELDRFYLDISDPVDCLKNDPYHDADFGDQQMNWDQSLSHANTVVACAGVQHFGVYRAEFGESSRWGPEFPYAWTIKIWVGVILHPSVFTSGGWGNVTSAAQGAVPDEFTPDYPIGTHGGRPNRLAVFMACVTGVHARVTTNRRADWTTTNGAHRGNERMYPGGGLMLDKPYCSKHFGVNDADHDGGYNNDNLYEGEFSFAAIQVTAGTAASYGGNMMRAVVEVGVGPDQVDGDLDETVAWRLAAVKRAFGCAFGGLVQTQMRIGYHPAHPTGATEEVHVVSERLWKADQLKEVRALSNKWLDDAMADGAGEYVFNDLDARSVYGAG